MAVALNRFPQYEAYAAEIRRIYAEAETKAIEAVAKRLARGIETPGWAERKLSEIQALNREIQPIVKDLKSIDPAIADIVAQAYDQGGGDAAKQLVDANLTDLGADVAFTRGNAVRAFAAATVDALDATHYQVLRSAMDAYRNVIAETASQVLTGVQTRRQATQVALNRFADRGIAGFTDKAGRRWDIASYAEMAVRTSTANASRQGHADKLIANDADLVIVSDSPENCPLCGIWENRVLSLTGKTPGYPTLEDAKSEGLYHQNCTHRTYGYFPGLTRIPHPSEADKSKSAQMYQDRQEQRRLERGIRQWKRREAASVTPEQTATSKAKVSEWQARMREHIDETGRRRKPERESIRDTGLRLRSVIADRDIDSVVKRPRGSGSTERRIKRAMSAIKDVHSLPYSMPEVPLVITNTKKPQGAIKLQETSKGVFRPTIVEISTYASAPDLTFVHEAGHLVDLSGMGLPGRWTSEGGSELMSKWRSAVDASDAVTQMRRVVSNGNIAGNVEGLAVKYQVSKAKFRELQRMIEHKEIWARSYSQYIAKKSGEQNLTRAISGIRSSEFAFRQWDDEDFAPIMAAMDELFGNLKWLKT